MFSMKSIEAMIEENKKLSVNKVRKPVKRKRRSSKREVDGNHIEGTLGDEHHEKENLISDTSAAFATSEIAMSAKLSQDLPRAGNPSSKKKKSIGVKVNPKVMHAEKNKTKKENMSGVVKKKKKKMAPTKSTSSQSIKTNLDEDYTDQVPELGAGNFKQPMALYGECDFTPKFDFISSNLERVSLSEKTSGSGLSNVQKKKLTKNEVPEKITCKTSAKKAPFYEESRPQQEEVAILTAQEKKALKFRKKEETKALELIAKKNLVSHPLDMFVVGEGKFIITLLPEQSVYLQGVLSVQPLVGRVTVLGYRLEEMERQDIFSLNSHALLSVNALEGRTLSVSQHSCLLKFGLKRTELQTLVEKQIGPMVVLLLERSSHPIVGKLSVIGQRQLLKPADGYCYMENLWGALVTHDTCHQYYLTEETKEWKELVENIFLYYECGNAPRIILCGGKGVGKSTLFKYVVNGLLSKRGTKVQCLDIDPGQTEMSVPSCISLTLVTQPLLGPPYTHHAEASSPNVHQLMIGGVSPQFGLQRYVKAVKHLFQLSRKQPNCPLVVNTMGWTVGTGLDLMLDTIRIVRPTHVIQIQGANRKNNFDLVLQDFVVQNTLGGVCTKPNGTELHYSLTEIASLSGRKDKAVTFTPKLLRELAVFVHLSGIVSDIKGKRTDSEESAITAIIQWPNVALHVCGPKIPKQRILQVLNGNLVSLCKVNDCKIESVGPDLPKHLIDDLDYGQCMGWGVIRGIDPLTKELYILTTVPLEIINSQVNAIIMPELHLPDKFYGFFSKGVEGPYYQRMSRSGAGRLKVSRQIKPSMPVLGPRDDTN